MKKQLLAGLAAGVVVIGMTGMASAVPMTITDTTLFSVTGTDPNGDLVDYGQNGNSKELADAYFLNDDVFNNYSDFLSWNHNFTAPPAGSIISATLKIYFGNFSDLNDNNDQQLEFANVLTEGSGGVWQLSNEIDPNTDQLFNVVLSSLADGVYNVQISDASTSNGGFLISRSDLAITYDLNTGSTTSDEPGPVPEPATMLLFGTGIASLAGSRLRRKKSV